MDGTIDVVRSRCGEWSNLYIRAIDLHVVNGTSPWLFRRFRLAVQPGAIGKDVEKCAGDSPVETKNLLLMSALESPCDLRKGMKRAFLMGVGLSGPPPS